MASRFKYLMRITAVSLSTTMASAPIARAQASAPVVPPGATARAELRSQPALFQVALTDSPGVTAAEPAGAMDLNRAIAREAGRQAQASQAQPAAQRSWVSRHKVLTAVIIGAGAAAVWGALLWSSCSNAGC